MFTDSVKTVHDVKAFFNHLVTVDRLNFHSDEDFTTYVSFETGNPSFTEQQAAHYNTLMDAAFTVCETEGADIYALGMEQLKGTSLA